MNEPRETQPDLPEGWYYPDVEEGEHLHAELQRELPLGHLLYGVPVQTFAALSGDDDTLFRHLNELERYTTIHLTWRGDTEIDEHHPTVAFEGTFADFLQQQQDVMDYLRCIMESRRDSTK